MTKVYLHGILGKLFGNCFKFKINNVYFAIKAIEANRPGFLKKLYDLSKCGHNYFIVVNGDTIHDSNNLLEVNKIETINFVPAICGSGPAAGIGLAIVGTEIAGSVMLANIASFIINAIVSGIISLAINLLANMLFKQGSGPVTNASEKPTYRAVGGGVVSAGNSSAIEGAEKSYIFNNKLNTAGQGGQIPIGYGRMKLGSSVVAVSIKSYQQSSSIDIEFKLNSFNGLNDLLPIQ